jgi:hypothetical protein
MAGYQLNYEGDEVSKLLNPSRISLYLTTPKAQVLTLANTWYKIDGNMADGEAVDFTPRGNPDYDVVYSGLDNAEIFFTGDADVSLSSPGGTLDFALFKGETEVVKFTSTTNITADTDIKTIGTNGIVPSVADGDLFSIRARCNVAGLTLTTQNLKGTWKLISL